jgi:2-methylcitrate dehydratase PrpD
MALTTLGGMAVTASAQNATLRSPYLVAFTDWLACACAGSGERAAAAVRQGGDGLLDDVAFAGTAGHVLDYDDTFSDGVAHVSATTAPAALMLAAHLELSLDAMLSAYAQGFEAMAAVARASHPALYDGGWHPTSVCGPIGAVVAASALLELTSQQSQSALAIALLRAGGTRGAFGSDGKAIQVGLAASAGVQAALLAQGGATVDPAAIHGPLGFAAVLGARWAEPGSEAGATPSTSDGPSAEPAISRNWIKLHPSCLGSHSPIDAAAQLHTEAGAALCAGAAEVRVHPVARQAAHLDLVDDGLAAKFSIPYCVAHTLMHGPPRLRDFSSIDPEARERSRQVSVSVDRSLPEFGAVLAVADLEPVRVDCPRGAPGRPAEAGELQAKITELVSDHLEGVLDDPAAPAARAARALSSYPR